MRVGIDIGGTFTDIITVSDDGAIKNFKIPSTPADPSQAVFKALDMLSDAPIVEVTHGSTVATNAILERKGVKTAFLTTDGFRDNIYIQRQNKYDVYDPHYRKPVPVVTRDLIVEVRERMAHTGDVVIPLDLTGLKEKLSALFAQHGVTSIAVCFLHAYKNTRHEREVEAFLAAAFPDALITLSSDVLPEFREYERASTTILSAYLKPVVARYIDRIESRLRAAGTRFVVMQSSGGTLLGEGAKRHPGQMFLSGPAAGVTGAVHMGAQCDANNLLTLDIGGTSTDAALISDGTPSVTTEKLIDGLPIAFPMIDIATIGAGGGSIAWIDDGGMLRVGPQSAGAEPGPACYGKGGRGFTVTDALLIMGLIRPDRFLGGRMKLDIDAAHGAAAALCETLHISLHELAESVFKINLSSVTQAMRLVSITRGHDPKEYTICAYGGGGPLHAALVAEELGVDAVLVPPHAGLFSAYGLLVADFRRDYVLTAPMRVLEASPERIREVLDGLHRQAKEEFADIGIGADGLGIRYTVDMRYVGQGHDLNVNLGEDDLTAPGMDTLRRRFDTVHLDQYGHSFPDDAVELVSFRARALVARDKPDLRVEKQGDAGAGQDKMEMVHWQGDHQTVRFLDRDSLTADSNVHGPAVVVEDTSTTLLPPAWVLRIDSFGNLLLKRESS